MFSTRLAGLLLAGCALTVTTARAAAPDDAPPDPVVIVDAFHTDLAAGRTDAALSLLTRDVLIFEQGFADTGRAAYAGAHISSDSAFAQATHYRVLDRRLIWLGSSAVCVLSQTRTTGQFAGRDIDLLGTETALLRKFGTQWRITHIHWSAHPASQNAAGSDK